MRSSPKTAVSLDNAFNIFWKCFALLVILISLLPRAHPEGQEPARECQNAASIHALSADVAKRSVPAFVCGVVTQTTPGGLTIQDASDGLWIYASDAERFKPGELVEVRGVVEPGLFAPVIRSSTIRTLGRRPLPAPKLVNFRQLSTGTEDDQLVSVIGVVRSVGTGPSHSQRQDISLRIGMQDGDVDAAVKGMTADDASHLLGSVVRIDAVELFTKNTSGQSIAPYLAVSSPQNVSVLRRPDTDLFATPAVPISRLMQYRSGTNYFTRVRIKGTVTYYEPGRSLVIEDASGATLVITSQTDHVHVGDQLDVIGFPTPTDSGPIISDANFRDDGKVQAIQPLFTTIEKIAAGTDRYKLVSVVGRLERRADEPSREIFILQDQSSLLLAELPKNAAGGAGATVDEGSIVRISGISKVDVEGPWNYGNAASAVVRSELLVRSPDDIQVIRPPSWWNKTHVVYLAFILALLTLAFLVLLISSRVEHSKLQGVLQERERLALEIHDTIIQGCVGVSSLLEAALGVEPSDQALQGQLVNYASEQARTTIESAREAVWALRSASTPALDAAAICEALCRNFQTISGVPMICRTSGSPFKLAGEATRELTMIVKEAIVNAITHAKPNGIRIGVAFTKADVRIEVGDDGRGFNPYTELSHEGHYGILGMRERVRLLDGSISIESKPELGTTVQIIIPRK